MFLGSGKGRRQAVDEHGGRGRRASQLQILSRQFQILEAARAAADIPNIAGAMPLGVSLPRCHEVGDQRIPIGGPRERGLPEIRKALTDVALRLDDSGMGQQAQFGRRGRIVKVFAQCRQRTGGHRPGPLGQGVGRNRFEQHRLRGKIVHQPQQPLQKLPVGLFGRQRQAG